MSLSDEYVIEELTAAGVTIADYFVIGEMPCCVNRRGELVMIAADEELTEAMVTYLRRIGAPEYSSEHAYGLRANGRTAGGEGDT